MKLTSILILVLGLTLLGCKPEQPATEFNDVKINTSAISSGDKFDIDEPFNSCLDIVDISDCNVNDFCQPLFNETSNVYIKCIETPLDPIYEEIIDEPAAPAPTYEEVADEPAPENDNYPVIETPSESDEADDSINNLCGNDGANNKKVIVCHHPQGNEAKKHSICISEQGWLNGHKNHHNHGKKETSQDYLGACIQTVDN
jgi:hypothetical protein